MRAVVAKKLRKTAERMTQGMPVAKYQRHKRHGHAILIDRCTRAVLKRLKKIFTNSKRDQRAISYS